MKKRKKKEKFSLLSQKSSLNIWASAVEDDAPLQDVVADDSQEDEREEESTDVDRELARVHGNLFQELVRIPGRIIFRYKISQLEEFGFAYL